MIINEKSLFVMACATLFFMIYAEGSSGQTKGAIDRQRWEIPLMNMYKLLMRRILFTTERTY